MLKLERKLYNSVFFRWLEAKSKRIILPGFQGMPLYEVVRFFSSQVRKVGLNDRARSIALSFLAAIPAATIFICSLLPYLPISHVIKNQMLLASRPMTPNQNAYAFSNEYLEPILDKPAASLVSCGFR